MKNLEFPVVGTKVKGLTKFFDINSPEGRKKYFEAKVGKEIRKIRSFLDDKTFIAYTLGKKNSGKGTYSQLIKEIFGKDKIALVSVGDLIREMDDWDSFTKTEKYKRMKRYYRGYMAWEDAVSAHLGRSTSKLLPTEFILALLKAHIDELTGMSIFIDGLPRDMDQISYSLYFRDLINYRNDPDIFVLIDIPLSVIDERIKYRVICPNCKTTRNIKLLPTSKIKYESKTKHFYLECDNPDCKGGKMVGKEGDDKGIAPIKERLEKDEEILRKAFSLYGVPKILLRNHVLVSESNKYFDNYEITPEFVYKLGKGEKVVVSEKPWSVLDDNGQMCNSLMAPPVVISLIKQLADTLSS